MADNIVESQLPGLNDGVIEALRVLAANGSTVKRLLREIADRHHPAPATWTIAARYFQQSFFLSLPDVKIVAGWTPGLTSSDFYINATKVITPAIYASREKWLPLIASSHSIPPWPSSSTLPRPQSLKAGFSCGLPTEVWHELPDSSKNIIERYYLDILGNNYNMTALSDLAERLQAQVEFLEKGVGPTPGRPPY